MGGLTVLIRQISVQLVPIWPTGTELDKIIINCIQPRLQIVNKKVFLQLKIKRIYHSLGNSTFKFLIPESSEAIDHFLLHSCLKAFDKILI